MKIIYLLIMKVEINLLLINLIFTSDYYGDVHETSTATQIFNQAVSQGQNAGLVQHQKDPLKVCK